MQEQKLERITPAQAGLDPQCIINMMDRMEKEHINITSFMLLRHGKVLCEASYEPYDATQLRTVYSLSKTFTSMAVGIAAGEGKIDLDEKITDLFAAEIENGNSAENVGKRSAGFSRKIRRQHPTDRVLIERKGQEQSREQRQRKYVEKIFKDVFNGLNRISHRKLFPFLLL